RRLWLSWNTYGLLDILFVVVTAARTALHAPASMQALLRLPLCLLPTFVVPLILVSHVLLFVRLRAATQRRERPGFLPTTEVIHAGSLSPISLRRNTPLPCEVRWSVPSHSTCTPWKPTSANSSRSSASVHSRQS